MRYVANFYAVEPVIIVSGGFVAIAASVMQAQEEFFLAILLNQTG